MQNKRRQALAWNQSVTGVCIVWIVDKGWGKEAFPAPVNLASSALSMTFKVTRHRQWT